MKRIFVLITFLISFMGFNSVVAGTAHNSAGTTHDSTMMASTCPLTSHGVIYSYDDYIDFDAGPDNMKLQGAEVSRTQNPNAYSINCFYKGTLEGATTTYSTRLFVCTQQNPFPDIPIKTSCIVSPTETCNFRHKVTLLPNSACTK